MVNFFETFLLAVVQAMTEFLPISSSGHLLILRNLLNVNLENSLSLDILLHVGTMSATIIFFKNEIKFLFKDFTYWITPQRNGDGKLVKMVIISTIPIVITGLLLKNHLGILFSDFASLGFPYLLTTIFLLFSIGRGKEGKKHFELGYGFAFVVGLAQAVAVIPGVSRSGMCVVVALMLGATRKDAVVYAFLISLPAITGALVMTLFDLVDKGINFQLYYFYAFLLAFLFGYLFLVLFVKIVEFGKLYYFAVYTFLLSSLAFYSYAIG